MSLRKEGSSRTEPSVCLGPSALQVLRRKLTHIDSGAFCPHRDMDGTVDIDLPEVSLLSCLGGWDSVTSLNSSL